MNAPRTRAIRVATTLALACACSLAPSQTFGAADGARAEAGGPWARRLAGAGITGGLVVHVGAEPTAAVERDLAAGGRFLVHGLAADWDTVHAARRSLAEHGLFPLANVAWLRDPRRLPLAGGLVRALIVDAARLPGGAPDDDEIRRALAFGGRAWIAAGDGWRELVKATPDTIDDWGHPFHGPDRVPLSRDRVAGPVTGLRWVGGTRYNRPQPGLRIVDGRVFTIAAVSSTGRNPDLLYGAEPDDPRIWLEARDAASGVVIWRRGIGHISLPSSGKAYWSGAGYLVATRRAVYTYPAPGAPLHAFAPATGEIMQTYPEGFAIDGEREAEGWNKGAITQRSFDAIAVLVRDGRIIQTMPGGGVACLDEASGRQLYRVAGLGEISYATWIGDRLLLAERRGEASGVIALDARSGERLWRYEAPPNREMMLFADAGSVVLSINVGAKGGIHGTYDTLCLDPATGRLRWTRDKAFNTGRGHVFPADGRVWYMDAYLRFDMLDPRDGSSLARQSYGASGGGCGIEVLTPDWIVRGTFLVPRASPELTYAVNATRPNCEVPMYPAYGGIFTNGTECGCGWYLPGSVFGFHAAPAVRPLADAERVQRPASAPVTGRAVRRTTTSALTRDWAWVADPIDGIKHARWLVWNEQSKGMSSVQDRELQAAFGEHNDRIRWYTLERTKPVAAGDLSLVAHVPGQTLKARRGDQLVWTFLAGARITVAPRIVGGLAVIGCNDGWIYALRVADGSIAWQHLAAPEERAMVAYGAVESTWPVFGVLLHDGALWYQAGRSTAIDDGLWAGALDPATGALRWSGRAVAYPAKLEAGEMTRTYRNFTSWATGLNSPLVLHAGRIRYLHSNHWWDPREPRSLVVNADRRYTPP